MRRNRTPTSMAIFLLLSGLVLAGCAKPAPPVLEEKPARPTETTRVAKAEWEQRWDSILSEAKKEGAVTLYSLWPSEIRIPVARGLKDKYAIDVESSPFSRGSDLLAKVKAEQRAGLYTADVFGAGNPTLIVTMKPEGLLAPLRPLLVLPEVLDQKAWTGGELPLTDKEGLAISMIATIIRQLACNTDAIKEGEITSYKDLLKPQYKDKIVLNDPSFTGSGNAVMAHLSMLWGEAEATDFLRRLISDQKAVVERDTRVLVESVARGKYAMAVAPSPDVVAEFISLKAPIRFAPVKEDNRVGASTGAISVPTKFAHPNAAVVFVNWLLTKEGQTILAKSRGNPSTRIDVPVEGFDPLLVPTPGQKYYSETEDVLAMRDKWLPLAKKIMDEAMR